MDDLLDLLLRIQRKTEGLKKLVMSCCMLLIFSPSGIQKTELLAHEIGVPYISTVDAAFLDSPQEPIPDVVSVHDRNG